MATVTEQLPTTHVEAHRWLARWLIAPHNLLRAYTGDIEGARREITSGMGARSASEYRAEVHGHHVTYRFDGGPEGTVKIAILLRLAAVSATRGAVDRVSAALVEHSAVHRAREERFGYEWVARPEETRVTPEGQASQQRERAALRELYAAAAAWWDGQPGVQLDLFGGT